MEKMIKCCICGKAIEDIKSNNPRPYRLHGRCCEECNYKYVIPARLTIATWGDYK